MKGRRAPWEIYGDTEFVLLTVITFGTLANGTGFTGNDSTYWWICAGLAGAFVVLEGV